MTNRSSDSRPGSAGDNRPFDGSRGEQRGDPVETAGSEGVHGIDLGAFRSLVRSWLLTQAPRFAHQKELDRGVEAEEVAAMRRFQAELFEAGLAGLTWPKEYGGQGLDPDFQRVYAEEVAPYELPDRYFRLALGSVGPTILQLGTESQRVEFLPKILRGEDTWSQLFSEPGAGSDLASLQTRAVRHGGSWVITGQKVWTSGAHRADRAVLLARTDAQVPKHQGLTMLILDMKTSGVSVRPLRQITGETHFNEVFLDEVKVPLAQVLGGIGDGWKCASTVLANERTAGGTLVGSGPSGDVGNFAQLLEHARTRGLRSDPVIRQRLAQVYIRQRILRFLRQRTQDSIKAGQAAGSAASVAKLATAMTSQLSSEIAMQVAGTPGQAWLPTDEDGARWSHLILSARSRSIGGGTSEIQRNILGERVLGLPREPDPSRGIAFCDLAVNSLRG